MTRWELTVAICPKNGAPKIEGKLNPFEILRLEGRSSQKTADLDKNQLSALIDLALDRRDFKWAKQLQKRRFDLCSHS